MTTEPTILWQEKQHQRILDKDATAFAELCEIALPYLVNFLQSNFPKFDAHLREMVVIDFYCRINPNPNNMILNNSPFLLISEWLSAVTP